MTKERIAELRDLKLSPVDQCLDEIERLGNRDREWQHLVEDIMDNCSFTEAHANRYRTLISPAAEPTTILGPKEHAVKSAGA